VGVVVDDAGDCMSVITNYLTQVSTWSGLLKLGLAGLGFSTGVGNLAVQAILAVAGVVDVIRNERAAQKK
jgi:hypothetical protein